MIFGANSFLFSAILFSAYRNTPQQKYRIIPSFTETAEFTENV